MSKFFCNGKKDFCDKDICPGDCEFFDNTGGEYIDDTVECKPTRADRIRAMSNEELAEWALHKAPEIGREYNDSLLGLIKWLGQPVEEER